MIRFHQTFGAHTGRVLSFDQEVVKFGRMPDCDVIFDAHADIDASGRHAEVRREAGQFHVVDSGSRNGTWLNGQRIQRAVLSSGDEIEFGLGGPRVKVEIPAHDAGVKTPSARADTGPMTPAPVPGRHGASTEPATPVPPAASRSSVDGNAPTVAAMATPVPSVGVAFTPHPPSAPPPSSSPSSPWAAPTPASDGGGSASSPKLYGERTVGLMIQSALAQAGRPAGADSSAEFIQKVAAETAQKSSRGLRLAIAALAALLVITLAVLGVVAFVMLRDRTGGGGGGEGSAAAEIAGRHSGAVYLLVEQREGRETATCSAFAVRSDLLATNAHCVVTIEERKLLGATFVAVGNRGQLRLPLGRMWHHPGFVRGAVQPSADVGLVEVVGAVPSQVELAEMADVVSLRGGDAIFVLGFPGDLSDTAAPVATISQGVVGRVTGFDGRDAPAETAQLLSHDAVTGQGTSGSPVFDAEGRVVAVNAGSYARGPDGTEPPAGTGNGHRYAVRSDVLAGLVAGLGR